MAWEDYHHLQEQSVSTPKKPESALESQMNRIQSDAIQEGTRHSSQNYMVNCQLWKQSRVKLAFTEPSPPLNNVSLTLTGPLISRLKYSTLEIFWRFATTENIYGGSL